MPPPYRCAMLVAALTGLAAGCKRPPPAFASPPPPEVTVTSPVHRIVEDTLEFAAITRGFEEVELRARVQGFVQRKLTDGGKPVKAGDLLLVIDPREYEAAVAQAEARVASMQAQLDLAEFTLVRAREAYAGQAVTQLEVDTKKAQRDSARAELDLATAELDRAKLNLEFTQIRAPIDGRMSIVTVDVGQLVGAGEPTLLGSVINSSKVYATYEVDERTVLEQLKRHANRRPGEEGRPQQVVRMQLADDAGYTHVGHFDRADNTVDTQTGTVTVEALFDNPDGTILPGLFCRVRPVLGERDAMLVPDVAVLADQIGRYVWVVVSDGTVERRDVQVGPSYDGMRRIDSGLVASDRVIVSGVQRARPGLKVNAKDG